MTTLRAPTLVAMASIVAALAGCGGGHGDSAPPPPTIVAAGDIGQCGEAPAATSQAAKTAALVTAQDALILTLGDNTYPVGAPVEFTDCFHPTWGTFKDRIRPSPGNHDYASAGAEGYYSYFGAQAGPDRRGYYSFDVAGWHFISLNSNIAAGVESAQHQWLVADLANSRATCTMAYWHYPVFSSGLHGNIAHMAQVFETLHSAGVDVVLYGHDHLYERFAPQTGSAAPDPVRGVRAFVVGTGGASLYGFRTIRPNSEIRHGASHGVLRVTLEAESYAWQFVAIGGQVVDAGRDVCHK